MPKYLFKATLSAEGVAGVLSEGGVARRDTVTELAESVGGSLESYYFAFGATDAFVVVDLPDNESAAAVAMRVSASGSVSVDTVVLLTPEQIDLARDKQVAYRPPGG